MPSVEGGCLCGAVRYVASGEATNRCYCHCRSCRLASGAPYVAWATFEAKQFRLVRGLLKTVRSSDKVERGFCPDCGTSITYRHADRPGHVDLALATLDAPSSIAPECHIWISHKVAWIVPGDGLPQYAEWRTGGA